MEDEIFSNMPSERPSRVSRAEVWDDDDATSLRISGSYVDHFPSGYNLNNQDQIMSSSRQPVFATLQGEPICDLLAGAHISNQPVYLASDAFISRAAQSHYIGDETVCESQQFGEGTLVPASMLASLLVSRGCVYENVDDAALCGPSNSRSFEYNYDPNVHRDYNNHMLVGMADELLQPNTGKFVSHSAEKGCYQNSWISTHKADLAADYHYGQAMSNNKLSSSSSGLYQSSIHQQCSEMSPSATITNHYDSRRGSEQSSSAKTNDCSLTHASCGKSQPMPTSSGSSYLKAVQQILADFSSFSLENVNSGSYSTCSPSNVASFSGEYPEGDVNETQTASMFLQRQEVDANTKQLKALLKMIDEGYNQCVREVHNVISAFHPITGLDPEVNACFVLQTTLYLYKSLKDRISAQILNMKENMQTDSTTERERSFESSFIHKQWALQQLKQKEHKLWRPQRGLPEQSVSVLRAWMFQNFLHPYPRDSDKHMLAIKSGLTRSQVSNWFINARVRLWKPMIEEMYVEINKRKTQQKSHVAGSSVNGKSTAIPM